MPITFLTEPVFAWPEVVAFETEWGYAGFACQDNVVVSFRFGYPKKDAVLQALLTDYGRAAINPQLMPPLQSALQNYFSGNTEVDFNCLVDISWATPTGRDILKACATIPYGQTLSYGELADKAGHPNAARAVGQVMAANCLPILIPCHRVIRSDNTLGGYSAPGGVDIKRRLLQLETKQS